MMLSFACAARARGPAPNPPPGLRPLEPRNPAALRGRRQRSCVQVLPCAGGGNVLACKARLPYAGGGNVLACKARLPSAGGGNVLACKRSGPARAAATVFRD